MNLNLIEAACDVFLIGRRKYTRTKIGRKPIPKNFKSALWKKKAAWGSKSPDGEHTSKQETLTEIQG